MGLLLVPTGGGWRNGVCVGLGTVRWAYHSAQAPEGVIESYAGCAGSTALLYIIDLPLIR